MSYRVRIVLRVGIPLSIVFRHYTNIKDRFLVRPLVRLLYHQADAIVAVSKGVAGDLVHTLHLNPSRISTIYNPVSIETVQSKAQQTVNHSWLADKRTPIILSAGRLRPQKGFDVLLKALALVNGKSRVRLIVLGEGDERNVLEQQARALGIADHVDFVGFVQNPYVYMARTDVFVLSSRWEGFPNVLVEAMALGIPVIASDCPYGPREILAPDSKGTITAEIEETPYGILVPPENSALLGIAITTLLGDRNKRAHYKKRAHARASVFEARGIIAQYKRVLSL